MVQHDRQAKLESSFMGICSSLDLSLLDDGLCKLSSLVRRIGLLWNCKDSSDDLHRTAHHQLDLDAGFLQLPPDRGCDDSHLCSSRLRHRDWRYVLPNRQTGWRADHPIRSLGQFCVVLMLNDLETEL